MKGKKLNYDRALMHLCWHELGPIVADLDKLRGLRDDMRFGGIAKRIEAVRSRLFVPGPHNSHKIPLDMPVPEMIRRMDAELMRRLNKHLKLKKAKRKAEVKK